MTTTSKPSNDTKGYGTYRPVVLFGRYIAFQFIRHTMHDAALTESDISRIIEMAWEDRTPFEAIELQFNLNESAVVALMRNRFKASSFKMWRKRTHARATKNKALRSADVSRHRAVHTRQN